MNLSRRSILLALRVYVAAALVASAALSPLSFSFAPVLLLGWCLYVWRRGAGRTVGLLTDSYMFLALPVMLAPVIGPVFSLAPTLPLLALITFRLEENAFTLSFQKGAGRQPTRTGIGMAAMGASTVIVALALGSLPMGLSGAALLVFVAVLGVLVIVRSPRKPVQETTVQMRILAGAEESIEVKLAALTKMAGRLFIESPYNWVRAEPEAMPLRKGKLAFKLFLTPGLSGPSTVKLNAQVVDRLGLVRTSFEIEPVRLFVVPKAKYAAWLARRYLARTGGGSLSMISDIRANKATHGFRGGVEYYGNRQYQPGDSLRSIDWKHSIKYNELISKEFSQFHGQSAIVLVNLAAGSAEEADRLSYDIVTTAMSLAKESVPAAIAAYDNTDVKLTTPILDPRPLVLQSLLITRDIVAVSTPVKYLNPPDVARLRADIERLRQSQSQAAKTLRGLLELEYGCLRENARSSPCTRALAEVLAKVDRQSGVIVVSLRNHDAEALAFNTFNLARKGNAVMACNSM